MGCSFTDLNRGFLDPIGFLDSFLLVIALGDLLKFLYLALTLSLSPGLTVFSLWVAFNLDYFLSA